MDSWTRFNRRVDRAIRRCTRNGCDQPFFRGHGSAAWRLIPGLGRHRRNAADLAEQENLLYSDFRGYAGAMIPPHTPSWEVLFLMQHHGLPTRLLDWSETFAVALYFAITDWQYRRMRSAPAVWVLDPYRLNEHSLGRDELPTPDELFDHEKNPADYKKLFVDSFPKGPSVSSGHVIAMSPIKWWQRWLAQKSAFTFHASMSRPLERFYPECVERIDVPIGAIPKAKDFLLRAGMNEFALFPDLDGLGRYLRQLHV